MSRKYYSKISKKIKLLKGVWEFKLSHYKSRLIFEKDYELLLPSQIRHDDVYLVSFPSSGTTWMCNILANINIMKSGLDQTATFYNYNQYIPDIHISRDIGDIITTYPGFRIIKSHANYNPYYKFVIYLVRNPFSVMKSFYNFSQYHGGYTGTLLEFVKDDNLGINAWRKHVESWLSLPVDLHVVSYEGSRKNSMKELKNLFGNIGLNVEDDIILKALELSNIERLRESESVFQANNPNYNYRFVKQGDTSSNLTYDVKDYIQKSVGDVYEEILSYKYNNDYTLK